MKKILALLLTLFMCFNTFGIKAEEEMVEEPKQEEVVDNYIEEEPIDAEGGIDYSQFNNAYIDAGPENANLFVYRKNSGRDRATYFPPKYSLKDEGLLPAVRNQGSYGSCWAHAICASAESTSIVDNELTPQNADFSELKTAFFTYNAKNEADPLGLITNDYSYINDGGEVINCINAGGNTYVAAFELASGIGFIDESEMPYNDTSWLPKSPKNFNRDTLKAKIKENGITCYGGDFIVENVDFLDERDTESIKSLLMNEGALTISYYSDSSAFDKGSAVYCPYDDIGSNHAVTLVGWDDNYSKDNFGSYPLLKNGKGQYYVDNNGDYIVDNSNGRTEKPQNDGAWIIRNSWGASAYDEGYMYLSYEDGSISNVVQYDVKPADEAERIYQYDGTYCTTDFL